MRPAKIKSKSNEKIKLLTSNTVNANTVTDSRKHQYFNTKPRTPNGPTNVTRPGSCPTNETSWVPSRDWHKYLSRHPPSSPSAPTSPRPKPQSLSPQLKATIPLPEMIKSHWHRHGLSKPAALNLSKPTDDLFTLKLPVVNFCSGEEPDFEPAVKKGPSFNDLCDDDKRKIAQLVEEIARCKQEKQEDEVKIAELKNKVSELKTSLKKLNSGKKSEVKTVSVFKSLQANEEILLKKQLNELNELLVQMQVQKATSEVHMKTISERAERMTRALHAMHRENTELQVELRMAKERLESAHQAVDKVTKELKTVRDHIKPASEDKSCQSSEDIGFERAHVKTLKVEEKVSGDQQILTELFFNKSLLKKNSNPKETIIFLSSDCNKSLLSNNV